MSKDLDSIGDKAVLQDCLSFLWNLYLAFDVICNVNDITSYVEKADFIFISECFINYQFERGELNTVF